jgi:CheY-like chemotaxis protein
MPRVLLVDDDALVRAAIEVSLQHWGYEVALADGAETGLHVLRSQAFDVVLVDIFMPQMRGFESIRLFRAAAPQIPLIAISGYSFAAIETPAAEFHRIAIDLGATCCLRKPFKPDTLLAAIEACLAAPDEASRSSK